VHASTQAGVGTDGRDASGAGKAKDVLTLRFFGGPREPISCRLSAVVGG
jgi:hypothetical protein